MNTLSVVRLLLWVSLTVTCAVFVQRGYQLLTHQTPQPAYSLAEQDVTHLLETLVGRDNVRVSINPVTPQTYLILLNGEAGAVDPNTQIRIETILAATQKYADGTDQLIIEQYPFARGTSLPLSLWQAIDVIGLFLIGVLQALVLLHGRRLADPQPHLENPPPLAKTGSEPAVLPVAEASAWLPGTAELGQASHAIRQNPDQAVSVLRTWLQTHENAT